MRSFFPLKRYKLNLRQKKHCILPNPEFFLKIAHKLNSVRLKIESRDIKSIFIECGIDPSKPIREQEQNPLPDRAELDNIIFDELDLTKEERKEVYWAVCELVQQRLSKASS